MKPHKPAPAYRGVNRTRILSPIKRYVRSHVSLMEVVNPLLRLVYGSPARGTIAMFHVGRCGSTALARILGQHSQLRWGNELFGDVNYLKDFGIQPSRRWVRLIIESAICGPQRGYFGFETKATHLDRIGMTVEEYVLLLRELGFSHFIVLTRRNLLRVIVSSIVGGQTKKWHVDAVPPEPTRVRIDVAQPWKWWEGSGSIINILETFERYYANCTLALPGDNRLDLNYESDIEGDPYVGYKKVCSFLDIEPEPCGIQLSRTNPFSIEQMIVNYDEVSNALRGSRFEWMLTA